MSKSVSDISAFYVADTKGAKVVAGLAVDFPTLTTLALSLKIKLRGMACRSLDFKDTGTQNQTPLSFVMLNYFRTNQYEEP